MRKRELVHLHALLDRIRRFAEKRGDLPAGALAEYEALDVAPTAVYRSKQVHEEAVITLTDALAESITDDAEGSGDGSRSTDDHAPSAQRH